MNNQPWYASWFDTPYYHLLYSQRDEEEARELIKSLLEYTQLTPPAQILDLACGKGRHSKVMNQLGFEVTGLDLSSNNIEQAKKSLSSESLHFIEGDMRKPFGESQYDAVFNLFTSFGYFDTEKEHLQTMKSIHKALVPGGRVLFDFLNTEKAKKNLVHEETLTRGDITFTIKRRIEGAHIIKEIHVSSPQGQHHFTERVRTLTPEDFFRWFKGAGLTMVEILDVPSLKRFEINHSDRMLVVGIKN